MCKDIFFYGDKWVSKTELFINNWEVARGEGYIRLKLIIQMSTTLLAKMGKSSNLVLKITAIEGMI